MDRDARPLRRATRQVELNAEDKCLNSLQRFQFACGISGKQHGRTKFDVGFPVYTTSSPSLSTGGTADSPVRFPHQSSHPVAKRQHGLGRRAKKAALENCTCILDFQACPPHIAISVGYEQKTQYAKVKSSVVSPLDGRIYIVLPSSEWRHPCPQKATSHGQLRWNPRPHL